MPLGLNRTDLNNGGTSYSNGTPITLPHNFGNPVTTPLDFGNDIPTSGTEQNKVTWAPSPSHFGNIIGSVAPPSSFLLQGDGVSHILLAQGGSILVS